MNQVEFQKRERMLLAQTKDILANALREKCVSDVADCASDLEAIQKHTEVASIRRECGTMLRRISATHLS